MRSSYDFDVSRLVDKFVNSVVTSTLAACPEMNEAVEQWKKSALRVTATIHKHSKEVFDGDIQDAGREAHRTLKPKIAGSWSAVYTQCGEEHGRTASSPNSIS